MLSVGSSNTIRTRITAPNNYHIFFSSKNFFIRKGNMTNCFVLLFKEIHSKMNSFKIPARNVEVPRNRRSGSHNYGIMLINKFLHTSICSNFSITDKFNTFLFHYLQTTVYDRFFKFKIRDTITEQAPGKIVTLI